MATKSVTPPRRLWSSGIYAAMNQNGSVSYRLDGRFGPLDVGSPEEMRNQAKDLLDAADWADKQNMDDL